MRNAILPPPLDENNTPDSDSLPVSFWPVKPGSPMLLEALEIQIFMGNLRIGNAGI